MKKYCSKIYYLLIILLFILSGFLMLYRLGEIPNGIHVDEAGAFYDAKSLIKYGVDRYLYHNPVYFINYGGGQNALYTYLATFTFRIFGISLWSFRFVSVIVNIISYYFYFKLVSKYKGKLFSVLSLFFLTILPVYIMKSRWGLESYLFNPIFIIAMYSFVVAVDRKKNIFYVIAGILFGICFYTYAFSYFIIPMFLVVSLIYLLTNKYITNSNIVCLLVPVVLLGIPLLLMLLINKGIIKNEIVGDFISIPKMWFYRGGEMSISNFKNIFSHLNNIFIGTDLNYNSNPKFGTLYRVSIPFVFIGLFILVYRIIKKRYDLLDVLMIILFISTILVCFCADNLNPNRVNVIYICFVYFIVIFLNFLYKSRYKIFLVIIMLYYCYSFISFSIYYFNDFESEELLFFEDSYLFDALDYVEEIRGEKEVYIWLEQGYIYPLLNFDIDPYTFNESAIFDKNNELVVSFGHYKFDYFGFYALNFDGGNDYVYLFECDNKEVSYKGINNLLKKEYGDYCVLHFNE